MTTNSHDKIQKNEEKEFNIFKKERPNVLFLGNGIHRAFGNSSWDDFLDQIKSSTKFTHNSWEYDMPMSLKASMLSENELDKRIRNNIYNNSKNIPFRNSLFSSTSDERDMINHLVDLGFDYVITTNYSYEIECSFLQKGLFKVGEEKDIARLQNHYEVKKAQSKYLINTFNEVNSKPPIWHIHGEARKPGSIIIGQDKYGRLLSRYIDRLTKSNSWYNSVIYNINNKNPQKIGSWIDAFVLGDVYIIGFGFDFSEIDLWWLLEYKSNFTCKNDPSYKGNTFFFEPIKNNAYSCIYDSLTKCNNKPIIVSRNDCKLKLMEIYNVKVNPNIGNKNINNNYQYKDFYNDVYNTIKKII